MTDELIALEKQVEDTLFRLMELEVEENIIQMGQLFAELLASLQANMLINYKLEVLVDTASCLPETQLLLESLLDVKQRYSKRMRLLTHRDILKVWLRKNSQFKSDFLTRMF
ncbi:hypothetical protein AAFN87_06440 [Solibacillus sp. CAU 1738]